MQQPNDETTASSAQVSRHVLVYHNDLIMCSCGKSTAIPSFGRHMKNCSIWKNTRAPPAPAAVSQYTEETELEELRNEAMALREQATEANRAAETQQSLAREAREQADAAEVKALQAQLSGFKALVENQEVRENAKIEKTEARNAVEAARTEARVAIEAARKEMNEAKTSATRGNMLAQEATEELKREKERCIKAEEKAEKHQAALRAMRKLYMRTVRESEEEKIEAQEEAKRNRYRRMALHQGPKPKCWPVSLPLLCNQRQALCLHF